MVVRFAIWVGILGLPTMGLAAAIAAAGEVREGVLVQEIREDFKGYHEERLLLREAATGRERELRFESGRVPDRVRALRPGSRIRVNASLRGEALLVSGSSSEGVQVLQAATDPVAGSVERVLVLVGNFADKAIECTNDQIRAFMFGSGRSVTNLYLDSSYGAVNVGGDVVGPYPLTSLSTGNCDNDKSSWTSQLDAAAQGAGVNLGSYTRKMYVVPRISSCAWAGLGQVGGALTWNNYCWWDGVYAHELGHNFGMGHASSGSNAYGDGSDFMGNQGTMPINAAHRAQMNWLPSGQFAAYNGPGIYELSTIDLAPGAVARPQALKIPKTDTGGSYYLSFRKAYGQSSGMSSTYLDRLNIHYYTSGYAVTDFKASLADGGAFTDVANGISVTQLSRTTDTVTFRVDASCTRQAPDVSISPASQGAQAGQARSYSVSVTNRDSALCGSSTFALGWGAGSASLLTGALASPSMALAPGQMGSVQLSVSSASGAAGGSYAFMIQVSDAQAAEHAGSAQAAYIVDASAPSVPQGLSATVSRRGEVSLSWTSSIDNVGVARYAVYRNGAKIGESSNNFYADAPGAAGTYSYAVSAIDQAGNASALSAPVAATIASKSGSPKRK